MISTESLWGNSDHLDIFSGFLVGAARHTITQTSSSNDVLISSEGLDVLQSCCLDTLRESMLENMILIVGLKSCVKPTWLKSLLHSSLTLDFFIVPVLLCKLTVFIYLLIYFLTSKKDMNVFQNGSFYRQCCQTPKGHDMASALTYTITMIRTDWRANKYKYSRHTWTVHAGNSSSPTASITTVRYCVGDSVFFFSYIKCQP